MAAGSQDGTVRLWDVASGALRTTLSGHLRAVRSLAFSPEGSALATASDDRTVRVWSVATGFEQATLRGHAGEVQSVAFSPGGKTLASGGEEGTLKLWHAATWQQLISLNAHRGGVSFLAFSPDGMVLASGGATIDGRGEIFLSRADTGATNRSSTKTSRDRTAILPLAMIEARLRGSTVRNASRSPLWRPVCCVIPCRANEENSA